MEILQLLCPARETQALIDEITDQAEQDGVEIQIIMYGASTKEMQGFIFLAWNKVRAPARFRNWLEKLLREDTGLYDVIRMSYSNFYNAFRPVEATTDTIQLP